MHIVSRLSRVAKPHLSIVSFSSKSLALLYERHGQPLDVLELTEEVTPACLPPATGNIQVRMLAAPINPADINQIQGRYPMLHKLPCVGGNEVVGEVIAVDDNCISPIQIGDWVVPSKAGGGGAWRQLAESRPEEWIPLPHGLDIASAATLCVTSSTAYRMLKDFKVLVPGCHCVIQNGANSAVGRAVIQLAKAMNISTVNVIRRNPARSISDQDLKLELMALGGDVVVFEDELKALSKAPPFTIQAQWPPMLGLNCVGGTSALSLAKVLDGQGVLVTYGGMSMEPVTIPTGLLIFKDLSIRGFWMTRWANNASIEVKQFMFEELATYIRDGKLKSKVTLFDLKEWRDAFGSRGDKVVLSLSLPSRATS